VTDEPSAAAGLWPLTVAEWLAHVAVAAVLTASLTGATTLLGSVSPTVRLAALGAVVLELLVPVYVLLDARRSGVETSDLWVHAAAMPVIGLFALVGYLDERRRAEARE
jgi:hypothetical protein